MRPPGRLAAAPEDDAFLAAGLAEALDDLVARLDAPAGGILGVILGGSLARGEGTVWHGAEGSLALSDLDLLVVVADERARGRVAPLARSFAKAAARRLRERGWTGPVDIGVIPRSHLGELAARPGTLEFRRSGRALIGPVELVEALPDRAESDIPREEALVLLENRGLELLAAWPGAAGNGSEGAPADLADVLGALYAGMKAVLDTGLALLVWEGRCPGTVATRQAALEALAVEGRFDDLRAASPAFDRSVAFWSAMKLQPDAAAIALHLGVSDSSDTLSLARRAWYEGARTWIQGYRALGHRATGRSGASLVALAEHAAHRARLRRRLRRWLEVSVEARRRRRAGEDGWALRRGFARVPLILGGAPEHELAATAAVLLGAWTDVAGAGPVPDWPRFMRRRFPGECPSRLEWGTCRRAVVRLWDALHLGGTRTAWDREPVTS